jgi:hypothetical protein
MMATKTKSKKSLVSIGSKDGKSPSSHNIHDQLNKPLLRKLLTKSIKETPSKSPAIREHKDLESGVKLFEPSSAGGIGHGSGSELDFNSDNVSPAP